MIRVFYTGFNVLYFEFNDRETLRHKRRKKSKEEKEERKREKIAKIRQED